jgi:glycerophosphoryl diester phosphodiesterase
MTLAELSALHIDASKYPGDFSCERIPTIEEVLSLARGKIHVLLDANKTDRVDLLVAAVQSTDTLEWAIFDTDSVEKIQAALALEPKLHTMIRIQDEAELDAELATFASHPPIIVELTGGASPAVLAPAVHAAGHRVFTDAFGTDVAAGLSKDASLYGPIYEAGVDIIQTDRPDLVLEYLAR